MKSPVLADRAVPALAEVEDPATTSRTRTPPGACCSATAPTSPATAPRRPPIPGGTPRLDARAWTTGDGPKSLFDAAAGWLRERRVLLPGASRPARLVGTIRETASNRLWDTLYGLLSTGRRAVLDSPLAVPPGARVCRPPGPTNAYRTI